MLRDAQQLVGLAIGVTDGELGQVRDFLFDDEAWVIRYLVVETGSWLSSRKVLVSPIVMGETSWILKTATARLTCKQVRNSPDIDPDKPVSRQHEMQYQAYYQYPCYWAYAGLFASNGSLGTVPAALSGRREDSPSHLRSCAAVTGYQIEALDGEIGRLRGMLVDEESWAIRYLTVNTSNWWPEHRVLIRPEWITDVSLLDRNVMVDVMRQAIQDAPPSEPHSDVRHG